MWPRSLSLVLCVGAVAAALGACGSSVEAFTPAVPADDGAPAETILADAGTADAPPFEAGAEAMAMAAAYQGNPLCNASPATSCCYPDALSLCVPTACEAPSDAGVAEASGGGYASQVAYGCHVTTASPHPADDATSSGVAPVTPACLPAGLGLDGALCMQAEDCAPGYECIGSPGVCRHYCCAGNDACLPDQFCDIQQTTGAPSMNVPVCMPIAQCDLLEPQSCPDGQTCAVVRDDGSESCVAIGNATVGQSCETDHCAAGLVCLGATLRTCYTLCVMKDQGQCPSGQSCKGGPPLFVDPGVGICQSG